ncbi:helix-turn-helix transcriptional regulator [Sphaerisporangium corydalis]|uniref:Helix-turn-helix transcriptional regulator n=1 Tax=Sphaerisporangium corydalis TaxID=1441875 RepID=A0ABV9EEH3_9ACTN|nr:WYL domain-containing protein [Sphaerisporangium corydalis]
MRASRLLSILLLLQTRGRLTARQLADILEVSVRTIYRDVEALHAAGVPLFGDAGPAGGYQLVDGYRTRLTGMTPGEAEALFLAGMPGPAAELGLGEVVAAAQLKIQAALPAEMRERATRIQERFHLDAHGWYHDGDHSPHLAALADAVWNQRRVRIRYHRWKEPVEVTRDLDPYAVVLKGGKWYLVGHGDDQIRTYRVHKVVGLTVLDATFERPRDFDLGAYWRSFLQEFRTRLYRSEAVVRVSPPGVLRMRELMSAAVVDSMDQTATCPDEEGWVTAVVPIESLDHAQSEFMRLGSMVEVLKPCELRERLQATARDLAEMYLS